MGRACHRQVVTNCNAHRFHLPSWINTTAVSGLTITVGLLGSSASLTVKLSTTSRKLSSTIVISTGTTVVPRSNTSCLDSETKSVSAIIIGKRSRAEVCRIHCINVYLLDIDHLHDYSQIKQNRYTLCTRNSTVSSIPTQITAKITNIC